MRVVEDDRFDQQRRHVGEGSRSGGRGVSRRRISVGTQLEQLVDLLLVLGDNDLDPGQGEDVEQLLTDARRIDADDRGADALRGQLGDEPLRPVVTEHRDDVAALDAEGREAMREVLDAGGIRAPRHRLPDAVALLLQRGLVRVLGREAAQQAREGRVGRVGRHQCSSAPR